MSEIGVEGGKLSRQWKVSMAHPGRQTNQGLRRKARVRVRVRVRVRWHSRDTRAIQRQLQRVRESNRGGQVDCDKAEGDDLRGPGIRDQGQERRWMEGSSLSASGLP